MGAGASTAADNKLTFDDVGKWSKEEVGEQVAAIGEAFEKYKAIAVANDVDGETLLDIDDAELAEYGVDKAGHRKKILKKVNDIKQANTAPAAATAAPEDGPADNAIAAARRFSQEKSIRPKLFMSYPRGELTTPFARWLKGKLESEGYSVWMDEEGIQGGVDFMNAIGEAIRSSHGIVAVIDQKFCGSTYCNNELAMAQGCGCRILPIIFRDMAFDKMPPGLQYMLASINCFTFPDKASDATVLPSLVEGVHNSLAVIGKRPDMRHGTRSKPPTVTADAPVEQQKQAQPVEQANATFELAPVPIAVPELPDEVLERTDMINTMLTQLLGFMGTGSVSLSSVKQKLSSHGQGGAGKTMMAVMLVRHEMVRRGFERIGWVSIGQTPSILEIQRDLYYQLTDERLEAKPDATVEGQLNALKKACKGKRWLVVLDDVWKPEHEKMLNCVDEESQSKLFVTTRIRGLLKGCDEVSLDLLTRAEAVDLLLRTGGVESTDEACAAAGQIADLCGDLPLYVGICGGIIADYEGTSGWQTELIQMLKEDRLMVMGTKEDEEGETVNRVVGTSLAMLKNEEATSVFQLLSLCPEDVPIPMEAVSLIWKACLPEQGAKANALAVRKVCKLLLDRNLVMGSIADGVHLHDIVRDVMRTKFEQGGSMRAEQRCIVQGIIATTPDSDWQPNTALGKYVRQSLRQHMEEAMPDADPQDDDAASSWLSASERVTTSFVVKTAAEVCGPEVLEAMSASHETRCEYLQAGLRLVSAANTAARFYEIGSVSNSASDADRGASNTRTLLHASDLLDRAGDVSVTVRTLHVSFGSKLLIDNMSDVDIRNALLPRVVAMFEAGTAPATAHEALQLAHAVAGIFFAEMGFTPAGAGATLDRDGKTEFLRGSGKAVLKAARQSYELAVRDGLDGATRASLLTHAHWPMGMGWTGDMVTELSDHLMWYTYERHKEMLEGWEFPASHMLQAQNTGVDSNMYAPDVWNLLRFGDVHLARKFTRRMAMVFEATDVASVPSLALYVSFALAHASSFFAELGTHDASLSLMRSFGCGFDTAEATVQAICSAVAAAGMAWTVQSDKGWFGMFGKNFHTTFAAIAKTAYWLHAPETLDREKCRVFLDAHVEAVSVSDFVHSDMAFDIIPGMLMTDVVRAMESVERYENGVAEAQRVLKWYPCNPLHVVEANRALGRCHAKLGRMDEAEAAFEAAIAQAKRTARPYHEMLTICDYIQAVLDPAGRRDEQLPALGQAILALVLDPTEYTDILTGYGLDVHDAVAAAGEAEA